MRILSTTLSVVLLLLCAQHAYSQKKAADPNATEKIVPLGISSEVKPSKYKQQLDKIPQRTHGEELARQREAAMGKKKSEKPGARKPMHAISRMASDSTIHVAEDSTRFTQYKKSIHAKYWSSPSQP